MKNKIKLTSVALVACIFVNVCSAVGVSSATLTSIQNGGAPGYGIIKTLTGLGFNEERINVGTDVLGQELVGILVFKLPELINGFEKANLSWTGSVTGTLPTIDIEILRFTILNDSVITGDFGVTAETHVGTLNTQAGETGFENTDLNSALSNNYQVDNFVVMRFRTQTKAPLSNYWKGVPTLTVVPEPSTYALLFGSFTLGFVMLRRRRLK